MDFYRASHSFLFSTLFSFAFLVFFASMPAKMAPDPDNSTLYGYADGRDVHLTDEQLAATRVIKRGINKSK